MLGGCGGGGESTSGRAQDTTESYAAQTALMKSALDQFVTDCEATSEESARTALLSRLQGDPNVKSATLLDDGVTIDVVFTTGTGAYVLAYSSDIAPLTLRQLPLTPRASRSPDWETAPKALVISPYAYKLISPTCLQELKDALIAAGYPNPVIQQNTDFGQGDVDYDSFKNWAAYRIVMIAPTHGSGYVLGTGVPLSNLELSNDAWNPPYTIRCYWPGDPEQTLGLKHAYFGHDASTIAQCGSLVYFGCCYSGTDLWANALKRAGAATYLGWPLESYDDAPIDKAVHLLNKLSSNSTVGEAVVQLGDLYAGPIDGTDWHLGHFIGGLWNVTENWKITETIDGESSTETQSLSATGIFEQDGCKVRSHNTELPDLMISSGTITGHEMNLSGTLVKETDPPVNWSVNTATTKGTLSADHNTVTFTASGTARGTFTDEGGRHSVSFTATMSGTCVRSSPVPPFSCSESVTDASHTRGQVTLESGVALEMFGARVVRRLSH